MATKKPRGDRKYNPDAPKHLVPGKKPVEEIELGAQDLAQMVLLENIRRQASEAQTNYLIGVVTREGYPAGIRVGFDMDWQAGKVRVTIKGKAQSATDHLINQAKSKEAPHE